MQDMLRNIDEEQLKQDVSDFKLVELTNLRETISGKFVEYSEIIEETLAKQTDQTSMGGKVEALVAEQKLEEASKVIRQAHNDLIASLSGREEEISGTLDKSRQELTDIIERYASVPVESQRTECQCAKDQRAENQHMESPRRDRQTRISEARSRKQKIMKDHITKLTVRYNALCAVKKREPFASRGFPVNEEYAKEMEARIQRLQDEMVSDREQAYIQVTVDRLIRGMGHDVIGRRDYPDSGNPKLLRSELYRCGGSSAIKASYSSDGEVLMEIVGLSDSDTEREPTGAETTMLFNEMESFCQEFSELRKQLKYLGIYQSMVYERSVEDKYARIESIREYKLEDGVSTESLLIDQKAQIGTDTEKKYLALSPDRT